MTATETELSRKLLHEQEKTLKLEERIEKIEAFIEAEMIKKVSLRPAGPGRGDSSVSSGLP